MNICEECNAEYNKKDRIGKPGKITVCEDCADEQEEVQKYTGYVVYDHKTSATLQINSNPLLTEYLINATKLKNKGSNMTDNINQCTKYKNITKTQNACVKVAERVDYKNKSE